MRTIIEMHMQAMLATIRETGGDLPPWQAIERYTRHACETGMWAGCESQRQRWAQSIVKLAGVKNLWPSDWGPYPTA